jgi:hypothetical protein
MDDINSMLHSHSGLERTINIPKHIVLVDKKWEYLFKAEPYEKFRYGNVDYLKVSIRSFMSKNGIFKNLSR